MRRYLICELCDSRVYEDDGNALIDSEGRVFCDDVCLRYWTCEHTRPLQKKDWESACVEEEESK